MVGSWGRLDMESSSIGSKLSSQMYVKSLALKGFKSFADPVTLDLQPGVNVVVGPNGSGKSNVIDAVAWVLGAQGARALRGGKMDDVIFAGAGKRPALGRAEVSLTIDNADRKIPMDFSEVTITRTLFRTGESEYQINGVQCRLLDIQELLSDSGVGRQQHVIVSQGNLDAVLAARPEDRRMIIEEAAGVLKHRKRREKSQRRLVGTESNLERLADLVREVRQQMRPLEKQADAARRHDDVAGELRGAKLYVAGREISRLQSKMQNADEQDRELRETDHSLRENLTSTDTDVNRAEAELANLGTEDFTEHVERLQSAFERAKGISAVLIERRRTVEADLSASVNADVIASLDHDAATTRRDLESVVVERESMGPRFDELGRLESQLASEWLSFEGEWGEGLPVASSEAAELRGEANALRTNVEELSHEVERYRTKLASLEQHANEAEATIDRESSARAKAQAALDNLADALNELHTRVGKDEAIVQDKLEQRRRAEQLASAAHARVETLTSALDASHARAGVEKLAGVNGVLGTLLDVVEIDAGYEAAFEAAAGEALAAVVVDSVDTARDALAHLRAGDIHGAVLSLSVGIQRVATDTPDDMEWLRDHVRGENPAVDQLLNHLIGGCIVITGGWEQALSVAARNPGTTLVTTEGDRFSRTGWRIGAGRQGATSAALAKAQGQTEAAQNTLIAIERELEAAEHNLAIVRDELDAQSFEQGSLEHTISTSSAAIERAESRLTSSREEILETTQVLKRAEDRMNEAQGRLAELNERLPALEAAEATGAERAKRWKDARSVLEDRSADVRARRAEVELRASSLDERREFLSQRVEQLTERLERHREEFEQAAFRRVRLEAIMNTIDSLRSVVESAITRIEGHLGAAREQRDRIRNLRHELDSRVREASQRRSCTERELMQVTERRQQHEVEQAEMRVRLEGLLANLESELGVTVEEAIEAPEPELPAGTTAKARIAELERELRQMGPINPLALSELEEVKERHQFLDEQLSDVQASRRELMGVIKAVDAEIVDVFRMAFEDVAKNFKHLFEALFPGGTGNLTLTDPENLLETGIEIEAKPSGKNVRTLSLLSGGERSLAAMAFLFAVFRSRPSPFYLLDEVEAALDDMNLQRFLTLLEEFRNEAQLVIVSHQKRTMERADCLYGVSMQVGGSTKVVSEKVRIDLTETAV